MLRVEIVGDLGKDFRDEDLGRDEGERLGGSERGRSELARLRGCASGVPKELGEFGRVALNEGSDVDARRESEVDESSVSSSSEDRVVGKDEELGNSVLFDLIGGALVERDGSEEDLSNTRSDGLRALGGVLLDSSPQWNRSRLALNKECLEGVAEDTPKDLGPALDERPEDRKSFAAGS